MPAMRRGFERDSLPLERILIRIRLSDENDVASWRSRTPRLGIRVPESQPVVGISEETSPVSVSLTVLDGLGGDWGNDVIDGEG